MSEFLIKIDSLFGGISPTQNYGASSQYDSALGIDPDMPVTDTSVRASGLIRPTAMTAFSSGLTGQIMWLLTTPKTDLIYAYCNDGKFYSYSNTFGSETLIGTVTSSSGNGAFYYDNYIYLSSNTDVARYGPLNGAASLTQNYWTSTLAKTALVNTTYPSLNNVSLPNHVLHYHASKNRLYILDVINGKGALHYISTAKTTVEGDTNNASTYNAFTSTAWGYLPTCIANYGSDIAIGCVQGTSSVLNQRASVIQFWDGAASAASKIVSVEIPDPYITAMKNVNGALYVWTGNAVGGCRVIKFQGGYSWTEVAYLEESLPPFQGATDHDLNRIVWGGNTTYPAISACVWALGSRKQAINAASAGGTPLHNIIRTTSTGTSPMTTALRYVSQSSNSIRQPIVAWKDGTSNKIDRLTTGGQGSGAPNIWRSQVFRIGKKFSLNRIRLPLTQAVASGQNIIATFYTDELTSSVSLANQINSTNYVNSEKNIAQRMQNVKGNHSFLLELQFTGTSLAGVSLPITIHGEVLTDGTE